jgi:hypothetical protein
LAATNSIPLRVNSASIRETFVVPDAFFPDVTAFVRSSTADL